jgi:hypothetical protein
MQEIYYYFQTIDIDRDSKDIIGQRYPNGRVERLLPIVHKLNRKQIKNTNYYLR